MRYFKLLKYSELNLLKFTRLSTLILFLGDITLAGLFYQRFMEKYPLMLELTLKVNHIPKEFIDQNFLDYLEKSFRWTFVACGSIVLLFHFVVYLSHLKMYRWAARYLSFLSWCVAIFSLISIPFCLYLDPVSIPFLLILGPSYLYLALGFNYFYTKKQTLG